jgi:hypothetical protein
MHHVVSSQNNKQTTARNTGSYKTIALFALVILAVTPSASAETVQETGHKLEENVNEKVRTGFISQQNPALGLVNASKRIKKILG